MRANCLIGFPDPMKEANIRKPPSKICSCIWHCPRLENWWQQGQLIGKCSKFNVLEIVVQCHWAMFSCGCGAPHHKKSSLMPTFCNAIGQLGNVWNALCLKRNCNPGGSDITHLSQQWHYTPQRKMIGSALNSHPNTTHHTVYTAHRTL